MFRRLITELLFLFLCAVPAFAELSSKITQQDPEAEKGDGDSN